MVKINKLILSPDIIRTNIDLATSFYHSRYDDEGKLKGRSSEVFKSNAAALQLYNKADGSKYVIEGNESKEYKCVSKPVTFKDRKKTNFGHSERRVIREVLYDLMKSDDGDSDDLKNLKVTKARCTKEELKMLSEHPVVYREYLEKRGITVEIWTERHPCGDCKKFLKSFSPRGSRVRYLVKPAKVEDQSRKFKDAYKEYKRTGSERFNEGASGSGMSGTRSSSNYKRENSLQDIKGSSPKRKKLE